SSYALGLWAHLLPLQLHCLPRAIGPPVAASPSRPHPVAAPVAASPSRPPVAASPSRPHPVAASPLRPLPVAAPRRGAPSRPCPDARRGATRGRKRPPPRVASTGDWRGDCRGPRVGPSCLRCGPPHPPFTSLPCFRVWGWRVGGWRVSGVPCSSSSVSHCCTCR
ncbi:unnamed protein product, partial [Closterium sp. NIES-54]